MSALRRLVLALALAGSALCAAMPARADTPITLYKSFSGNVNFTGTQVTIRDKGNNAGACKVSGESTIQSASLSLPWLAKVVSAQLYWAGSGSPDTTVSMNGKAVDADRSHTSATIGGGFDYFSSAADVTEQVRLKGSGTYTFSGLKVANGRPWCERSAVMGGYALVVVYSHLNESFRTLNLYEGLRALLNSEVRLDMANFRVPDNVPSSAMGRFGHLVWEGDQSIAYQGESLAFNSQTLTQPTYGPSGNNFNSRSSINADDRSIGIDFDSYNVGPWTAKQNAVSAVFRAGGDMVLLNAAMLAVPSTAAADLAIDLVRGTELRVNATATYAATVSNLGPGTETGPFSVKLALPAGMTFVSGSGTSWTCTGSGTAATCTFKGVLEKGARTVLTLKASVSKSGSMSASVAVAGNNDPAASNDTDSDTAAVATSAGISYEFTRTACKVGELVGDEGTCKLFSGPVIAGARPTIYLTAVDSANKARAQSANQATDVPLYFALGCVNPSGTAGAVQAQYGSLTLNACAADGTVPGTASSSAAVWKSATVQFKAGEPSLGLPFSYVEAGAVKLYVRSAGGATDFAQFVSMPDKLNVVVRNAQGLAPRPGDLAWGQNGFVRAGEPFTVQVSALSAEIASASGNVRRELANFGRETGELQRPVLENVIKRLDTPAAGATDLGDAPLSGAYPETGAFSGSFSWSDVGSFTLTVSLGNYLGEASGALGEARVGRVYPAYFSTVAGAGFACLPRMRCPYIGLARVNGAVYSRQPFEVTIVAHDENGRALPNFDLARYPSLVPKLALAAVDAPGTGVPFGSRIQPGLSDVGSAATTRTVSFGLGAAFDADRGKTAWLAPTAVYLRATAPDSRFATPITISSVQPDANESEEGGIMVVNGRLAISNVIGSELLKTPIRMQTQYWSGSSWENNSAFASKNLLNTGQALFSNCQRTLSLRGMTAVGSCNTQLVRPAAEGRLELAAGSASYLLAPVGAGQNGSFRIRMKTEEWLPSMYGQVAIGAYKSPVIFIREMY